MPVVDPRDLDWRSRFLDLFEIGSDAHARVMRRHNHADRLLDSSSLHLGERVLDKRIPVAHTDESSPTWWVRAASVSQFPLQGGGLRFGQFANGRTSTDFLVALGNLMNHVG